MNQLKPYRDEEGQWRITADITVAFDLARIVSFHLKDKFPLDNEVFNSLLTFTIEQALEAEVNRMLDAVSNESHKEPLK